MTVSTGNVVRIVGVVGKPATKSSFQFDIVLSNQLAMWSRVPFEVVRLYKSENVVALNQKLAKPMKLETYMDQAVYFQLLPLEDIYFNREISSYAKAILRGNEDVLRLLGLVSGLILLIGLFNYVNLYTVMMQKRGKELGVKQVFGANRLQIFLQLYAENVCLNLIALFFVWLFIELTRNVMDSTFGIPVQSDVCLDWLLSGSVLFVLPFLTALYPFWKYTHASPIHSLRSVFVGGKSLTSRFVFLFFQYVITFCLVVAAIYLSRQLYFLLHTDVGYKTDHIIYCNFWKDNPAAVFDEELYSKEREKRKQLLLL